MSYDFSNLVSHIFIAHDAGVAMRPMRSINALAGLGLDGDRYARQQGSWKAHGEQTHKLKRNLTVMSTRAIAQANHGYRHNEHFTHADTRRNVFIDMDVNKLIGKEFCIGTLRCRGIEYATPCDRPSKLSGKPNFEHRFLGLGGVNCEVLEDGVISVSDEVEILGGEKESA